MIVNSRAATAYGASRMTHSISFRLISYRPCTVWRKASVAGLRITAAASPTSRANRIRPIRSLRAAASTTLRGTMFITRSLARTVSPRAAMSDACIEPCSISDWATSGGRPRPGCSTLTATSPISAASAVTSRIHSSVLPPMRPSDLTSPISITPSTRAENTSGTTSMNSRRRKICPAG